MKIYFLPIPAEPMFTILDSDTKRKFRFTVTTNPHEVPDKLGEFLIKTRPILFGANLQQIHMVRGEIIPKKVVTKKPTKKTVSIPNVKWESSKGKGGK